MHLHCDSSTVVLQKNAFILRRHVQRDKGVKFHDLYYVI